MVDRVHRQTTDEEVAEELGISLEAYFRVEAKLDQAIMVALEDVNIIDRTHPSIEDPETIVERAALLDRLVVCREELPERERLVIALYYEEELTLQEIAEMLDVTEGRICQIHNTALLFLRDIFDQPSVKKSAAVPPVSTGDEIAADLLFLLEDTPPLDTEDIVQSLQTLFDDP
jgi:DNA-directed RNA polymerase specialized sigma subunit